MKLITWLVNQYYFIRNKYYFYYPKSWAQEDITPQVVSKRFRKLFIDHGVEVTQILGYSMKSPLMISKLTIHC
jgi:hypothetical protein